MVLDGATLPVILRPVAQRSTLVFRGFAHVHGLVFVKQEYVKKGKMVHNVPRQIRILGLSDTARKETFMLV